MGGKVVILVPAYQCQETVAETLESLQSQGQALTRVDAVIVADDGSRDQTKEVALQAWRNTVPLRVLKAPMNRGEYVNVNEAVSQFDPEVEWLLIMHADNVAKERWLEVLLARVAEANDKIASICASWDDWMTDGTIHPGENKSLAERTVIAGSPQAVRDTLMKGCWWHISCCAIRVAAYRDVGGLPRGLRLKGDWDFLLRLLSSGWDIEYVPLALMKYRQNPQGSSSLSFRLHSDIKETMQVVRWHCGALSLADSVRLHGSHLRMLARRSGGSALRGHWRRLFWSVPTMFRVVGNLFLCLPGQLRHQHRHRHRDRITYNG
jgi:glycosyltransferase involved in cell wall biosynthesis